MSVDQDGRTAEAVREEVRLRYAAAARAASAGRASGCGPTPQEIELGATQVTPEAGCCGAQADASAGSCCETGSTQTDAPAGAQSESFGPKLYDAADRDALPEAAVTASLGCGNPVAVAELREGETVLDLGSGGGIDVLLSARRVGASGRAYGLDMTEEMLELARHNAEASGVSNVEFRKGHIEDIPLLANTVDVVISNCVINLSVDKPAVFAETFRVLKPGGRFGVTDVIADDHLNRADRADRGEWAACVAGALSVSEYRAGLQRAGFADITITPIHQVANGMHSAIIKSTKPAG